MKLSTLAVIAVTAFSLFGVELLLGQSSTAVREHDLPARRFRIQVRDSGDVDGDVIKVEVIDRTDPKNNRVLAERIDLTATLSSSIVFDLAQPVNATITVKALADSSDPKERGRSGVSLGLRIEDTLEGQVWERQFDQFSEAVDVHLTLATWSLHERILTREQFEAALKGAPDEVRAAMAKGMQNPVVAAALVRLGEQSYSPSGVRPGGWVAGTNKCNLFVHDVLVAAGFAPPLGPPDAAGRRWPRQAGDLGSATQTIPGLPVNDAMPRPGDVVAAPMRFSDATGHAGVVVAVVPATADRVPLILVAQAGRYGVVIKPIETSFPASEGYPRPTFRTPSR